MQTISIPWKASCAEDAELIALWQRTMAAMVRTGYAAGDSLSAKEIEVVIKNRFPDQPLGSWAAHCAAMEAASWRKKVSDGTLVFGGKANLRRRTKGLISNEEWKSLRQNRALSIIGDRTRWGNRHFRLSADGRTCKVDFLKQSVTLQLPEMSGKYGKLLRAISILTDACQISVQFSLSKNKLSITFNPMDLRKLPSGKTLEDVKISEQGKGRRGRKRKDASTHYAVTRIRHVPCRPVHPEWRDPLPVKTNRTIGLDLNPEWIGISVIEVSGDPQSMDSVKILDHKLHNIRIPLSSPGEAMSQVMAFVASNVISMARAWNCGTIFYEDGLGKLRWSKKKNKHLKTLQTLNYWSRNKLIGGLIRRCQLSGIKIRSIWGGYSTTIGNLIFDLPDACASAAEIARRGYASTCGIKDRLPLVPVQVASRRWKDETLPTALAEALASADRWDAIHRAIKTAKCIGYRRLHPSLLEMKPGRLFSYGNRGYAVNRLGNGKGASCSARPVHQTRTVQDSLDRALTA
jgi:hypothetical protein